MAFWSRLKQAKPIIHHIRSEFKRCYVSNHVLNAGNLRSRSHTLIPVSNNPNLVQGSSFVALGNVRFYAAPAQFLNQKKEEKDSGPKLNEEITSQFIRLVTDEGHTVISRNDALARAKSLNMDLVEVDSDEKPVVCKIFDYNKAKFLRKVREKENKKLKKSKGLKSGTFKEVRFAAKISQKDLQVKADMVKRLLESGNRVKCTAIDPTADLDLETLLSRFSALIEGVAIEESAPQVEQKQAFVVVRHVKFGGPKKSSKSSKAAKSKPSSAESSENQPQIENADTEIVSLDGDETIDSETVEDIQPKMFESTVHRENDLDTVFPSKDDVANRNPRHVLEYEIVQPTPVEVQKPGIANRYARDPRSVNPPRANTEMRSRQRFEPASPQDSSHSSVRNFPANSYDWPSARNPVNNGPQVRNQPQMKPTPPHVNVPKHDSSQSSDPNSPAKTFGIFSSQPTQGQNIPGVSNRYKRADPSSSARSPSPRMDRGPDSNNEFRRR